MRRNAYIMTICRHNWVDFHYAQNAYGIQRCRFRGQNEKSAERLEADNVGGALMCTTHADVGDTPWRSLEKWRDA